VNKLSISPVMIVHWALYALIVVIVGAIGFGVYETHQKLSASVIHVDHLKIDSELNQQGLDNARKLRRALDENRDSVARAAAIVADTKYYEYQDQIVHDISSYAAAANLTVLGFDFTTSGTGTKTSIKGIKTVVATVSLKSPVAYTDYLRFLKLIERNLTKMQVTQLDISNDLKTAGAISSPIITLEVFVR